MPEKKHIFNHFKKTVTDYYSKNAILFEKQDEYHGIAYSQLFETSIKIGNILKK